MISLLANSPLVDRIKAVLDFGRFTKYSNGQIADAIMVTLADEPPIDMILRCPKCGLQHIDEAKHYDELPGGMAEWTNPPHRSHLCAGCGHIWRPADVPTNGVAAIKTRGRNDS